MTRAYPRSSAILRAHGAQYPERLPPDAFAEYMGVRQAEDAHYDALDRARHQRLRDAAARGRARLTARRTARRAKVAAALAADPNANLAALARTLGVSRCTIYLDRVALGL